MLCVERVEKLRKILEFNFEIASNFILDLLSIIYPSCKDFDNMYTRKY